MKNLIWLIGLLFSIVVCSGQEITRQEADSIVKAIGKSKADIHRLDLLLSLAQFHIFKPGEAQIDFDSAMRYINQAAALTKKLKSSAAFGYQILTESYLRKEQGKKDEAKKMVEQAVTILEGANYKDYLGKAYYELSMYYDYTDSIQLIKKTALVEQSIDAFQLAGDLKGKGRSLQMLGDLYNIKAETDKSIEVLNRALATYDSINYQNLQGVYVLLGSNYKDKSNYGQALFYLLKALKTAQITSDTLMQLCQIQNQLGSLYFHIGRDETSIKYYEDAMKIAQKCNDEYAILIEATNLSNSYNRLNQSDKALKILNIVPKKYETLGYPEGKYMIELGYLTSYLNLRQLSKAQPYCGSLLKIADRHLLIPKYESNIYRTVSNFYFNAKDFVKSRKYLTKSIDIGKTINYTSGRIQDLQLQYKLDSAQQLIWSAFNHLLDYKAAMDSATSERNVRQFEVLNVEYEVGMKEDLIIAQNQNIASLRQKSSLQQINLRQANLIRNVTVGGIVLTLLISGLIFRQYREKQKNNQLITRKNDQLQHLLSEKDWLLKEIHHRVKNNLQIVMSLLSSQAAYIDNETALTAIHDSQHRVHAMSLIHQKLYGSENLSFIDISGYVRELVSYLSDSFTIGQRIRFEYQVAPLEMDASQAVPLGLILNEAITNAIKYAFPDGRSGVVSILLSTTAPNHYLLNISDNGIGMPLHFNYKKGSLGLSLMRGLSQDLNGDFSIKTDNGTSIIVAFVQDRYVRRQDALTTTFDGTN